MGHIDNKTREFLTPQQIAEELQLNVLTVYSYIKGNQLPAIRLGRNYRVSREDLYSFLINHKTGKGANQK